MSRRTWWLLAAGIAALAILASWTGLHNQFAYDDVYVVQRDARIHTLHGAWRLFADSYWGKTAGGDGYRPLTNIGFALEWAVGNGSPLAFHAVNVALYAVLSVLVFWVAGFVLPYVPAWIAAALFAVHPVHVEAVANVVGQSELTVAVLLTLAVGLYLQARLVGPVSRWRQAAIAACYALAMLFKEHGIVLLALIPAAEILVVRSKDGFWKRLVALRPFMLVLLLVAMGYLLARSLVLVGDFAGFQPYVVFQGLHLSTSDRILTMIGVAPQWARLFLWPARLMTEYAPPYVDIAQGPSITQLPGLLLMIGVVGLAFTTWKRAPALSFGLWWVIIAMSPVSNLVLPAGFIIAERTLLFPSIGAMLAVGAVIPQVANWLYARRLAPVGAAVAALLIIAGAWRSAERSPVWHDNNTLFRQAIIDTPDSYRAHYMLGAWYIQNHRMRDGEAEYQKAMKLFQFDPFMAFSLAEGYRGFGLCKPAIDYYRWALAIEPSMPMGRRELGYCLLAEYKFDSAKVVALDAMRRGGKYPPLHEIFAKADSAEKFMAAHRQGATSGEMPDSLHITASTAAPSTGANQSTH
ncbi:MAG TPA: hypothetical protein VG818_02565 [Gemmatimonadaceae bacterium]|nr:hypothetical protein [Gemmatimonadaceae bacterium]